MWEKKRIWTVAVVTSGEYQGLGVTPNIYTTLEEIGTFLDVMEKLFRRGPNPA